MSKLSRLRRVLAGGHQGRFWLVALVAVLPLAIAGASQASHLFSDTAGHTTLEQKVTGSNPEDGYSNLHVEPSNTSYRLRDGASEGNPAIPDAQPGREQRRRSLNYFGQLTDFQLADEESPARVEFLDKDPFGVGAAAWRPQEALAPFVIDWSIRQMNLFAPASPVQQGDGTRAAMDFALMTGDQADNMQRNETRWTRELLEGRQSLNFNSGSPEAEDYDPAAHPSCAAVPPTPENLAEAARYTGVQDYNDYDEGANPYFYDPNDVRGSWAIAGWPTYTGLMDRAQQLAFQPAGLDVPSYVTNGNHDGLVQGNEDANAAFEDIAMGCLKMLASAQPSTGFFDPNVLLGPAAASMNVPPDPERRFVDKRQIKALYGVNGQDHAHGYDFVDPAEDAASNGSASYYAWDPPEAPGFRYISIDTLSEGGVVEQSANGNIDDPQFQWLKSELDTATARDRVIVIFGHHPVRTLTSDTPDEAASFCDGSNHSHGDSPEHNHNPGCDIDPRNSSPVHLGQDRFPGDPRQSLVELLDQYPHVIAYIAGHTHQNLVAPFTRTGGGVWWGIETSATADWPVQHRLIEVMDNRDGTLSIFGTVLDAASAAPAPPAGSAAAFNAEQLASIGRVFTYNDPQGGPAGGSQGNETDNNVELLVRDPRVRYPRPGGATPLRVPLVPEYRQCSSPDSQHVAPLDEPSCTSPQLESSLLTTSRTGRGSGSARLDALPGNPSTGADEADVRIQASASDVRRADDDSDYTGDLLLSSVLRITDSANGSSQSQSATVQDFRFSVPVDCSATPVAPEGGACNLSTTADTLVPGFVREGDRTIISSFSIELRDVGPDGSVTPSPDPLGLGCPPTCGSGDERVFLRQGLFAP
jgi:3',5'-cyclic AMP phosphodiesterase CpdA